MRNPTNYAQIETSGEQLAFSFSFNTGLVAALKATIPGTDRTWDGATKTWLVTPEYGETLQNLSQQYLGYRPGLPAMSTRTRPTVTTILEVRYVGRVKERADGATSAFGWSGGSWSVIFPGDLLRKYFGADPARPGEAGSLYAVLGVDNSANDTAIKKAYRRAAMQWHPDHCSEAGAADQFRAIQAAYEVLADANKRAKYNAGLLLQASLGAAEDVHTSTTEWAAPLRCGYVMASGVKKLGRFVVSEILGWEDIQDKEGRVLVSSWPIGTDHFVERWV